MSAITEDYVSFETAKLLKEKGFNEPCWCYWNFGQEEYPTLLRYRHCNSDDYLEEKPTAPTLQMAMKWLRKVHKIFIEPKMSKNTFLWGYRVSVSNGSTVCLHASTFNECEESCEAAIKYCLENLI